MSLPNRSAELLGLHHVDARACPRVRKREREQERVSTFSLDGGVSCRPRDERVISGAIRCRSVALLTVVCSNFVRKYYLYPVYWFGLSLVSMSMWLPAAPFIVLVAYLLDSYVCLSARALV